MVRLPIIEDPWIQTYQIRNYELGIVQDKTPWIYSKYINCYYDPDEEDCFNHCVSSGGRFFIKDGALLGQKFIFDKSIFSLGIINFVDWIKNFLKKNWYILCYVDEFYIKAKGVYKTCHYRHTLLIYGFDDKTRVLYAIGYDKEKKYEKFQVSFNEFEQAIDVHFDRKKEQFNPRNIEKIEFNIVKINPEFKFVFNLKELYTSLSDYIDSVDSFNPNLNKLIYGIECEREFQKYVYAELYKKTYYLDPRYSRLFMELKEIMVRRLDYLIEIEVVPEDIVDSYKGIVKDQVLVHMLFMKYNVTHKEDSLKKIVAIINSIIEREKTILSKIRQYVFDYLLEHERSEYY
jgi:hypothetical protein